MPKTTAFDKYYMEYEKWFQDNAKLYDEELKTLKSLLQNIKNGLEIGIGTGRFAIPMGINTGIEPSEKMRNIAISKGLNAVSGVAESIPFEDSRFDFAMMITTVCFVDDILKSFKEAYRVTKDKGFLVVGYVDKNSKLGVEYQQKKKQSKFYKDAKFYTTDEIVQYLKKAGFCNFDKKYVKKTEFSFVFLKAYK